MEAGLKAARAGGNRQQPRRRRVVALSNSFHGRTAGALAIAGQERYRRPFEPLMEGVEFIPPNDCGALRMAVDGETAAVVTETVQGEGGIWPLQREFVAEVRNVTHRSGALWIADETQCGLGRTGNRFAYQMYKGVDLPDIVVTAKPLAGGLPLGATMFSEEAAAAIELGMHGTTFGGGPLACRVALETLSVIDELLPRYSGGLGLFPRISPRVAETSQNAITEIRAVGLMAGIQLSIPGEDFVQACAAKGLAINCTHETVLRLLPPFIVTSRDIVEAVAILDDVLSRRRD